MGENIANINFCRKSVHRRNIILYMRPCHAQQFTVRINKTKKLLSLLRKAITKAFYRVNTLRTSAENECTAKKKVHQSGVGAQRVAL